MYVGVNRSRVRQLERIRLSYIRIRDVVSEAVVSCVPKPEVVLLGWVERAA